MAQRFGTPDVVCSMDPVSSLCMWIYLVVPALFVEKIVLSSLKCLETVVESQLTVNIVSFVTLILFH